MSKNALPDRTKDFSSWYNTVIESAELVDQSPTRGCVVLRPYGYAIWERLVDALDKRIKEQGAQNAYFPLFIPESFLKKEAEHVEGFSPELAVVTHAGGKKLEEPYVVRPTSETIVYHMFARWINSWRDLPLKINQWSNVVRWEMRTRAFLRTTEILWQEGHTAHATYEEADAFAKTMLDVYTEVIEEVLAIPVFKGVKTEKERFAGAHTTYCMEGVMPDGKALQMGTSHVLAHSFPASYNVSFQDKDGSRNSPWCTSWGVTARLIGATIMVHGDEKGLILPPAVAPYHVVIVPIFKTSEEQSSVMTKTEEIAAALRAHSVRVTVDNREMRPGAKFFHWEQKGVPLRLEIGPRDVAQDQAVLSSRVPLSTEGSMKEVIPLQDVGAYIASLLPKLHDALYARALKNRESHVSMINVLDEQCRELLEKNKVYCAGWCGKKECEETLTQHKAGIRCIMSDKKEKTVSGCFNCQAPSAYTVLIAKGY